MSGHIRFIRNINLNVNVNGEQESVPFGFGEIYPVERVIMKDSYCDIIFEDGSIAEDVSPTIFEVLKATVVSQNGDIHILDNKTFHAKFMESLNNIRSSSTS